MTMDDRRNCVGDLVEPVRRLEREDQDQAHAKNGDRRYGGWLGVGKHLGKHRGPEVYPPTFEMELMFEPGGEVSLTHAITMHGAARSIVGSWHLADVGAFAVECLLSERSGHRLFTGREADRRS